MAQRTVSGKITDETGESLPGVNVLIKGTTTGTQTDLDGNFQVSVDDGAILVFSYVGFETQEIDVGARTTIDITMGGAVELQEVVVTAQGIERDVRSLGYATQNVKGDLIAQKAEPNVLNTLQGKVTGVYITQSGGAPGSSTNINIRGVSSFNGNNQPLIVIDGAIVSNAFNDSEENTLFASPISNRLNDIDPETIESINVLKGPAAAVLYGSRAANGAIIITTKSGKNTKGKVEITVNSSVTFQRAVLPEYQNTYGAGSNNEIDGNSSLSWGPAFGTPGNETITYGATLDTTVAYRAHEDNIKDFYNTGVIYQNSITLQSGNDNGNFILSLANTEQEGIVPNSEYSRYNVGIGGESRLANGLKINTKINYIRTQQLGTVQGNSGSAPGQLTRVPRSFDLNGLPFEDPITGENIYFSTNNNPLWSVRNLTNDTRVDRVFGNFNLSYDVFDWLNVRARITGDFFSDRRDRVSQIGSARAPQGEVALSDIFETETNFDFFVNMKKDGLFGGKVNGNVLLGYNINQRTTQDLNLIGQDLTIPQFTNITNASTFSDSDEDNTKRRLIGYYSTITLDYSNWLFLELQGRIDLSSTLPEDERSFFYPGASLSVVLSDALEFNSSVLNYLKLRGSFARVGNDADPYLLNSVYLPATFGNNVANISFPINVGGTNIPGFAISSRIGSADLTPEFTNSYEVGLNFEFFSNRISGDVAYFYTESEDQIIDLSVAPSSGFLTRTTNVGLMTNQGWEITLSGLVVESGNFSWNSTVNFTRIRNKVDEIAEGVDRSDIEGNRFTILAPSIEVGEPYGVFVGLKHPRNEEGRLLVNPTTGFLEATEGGQLIGDPNPDWLGGFINDFKYKNLSLSIVLDARVGGDIFSFEAADEGDSGALEYQADNRQEAFIIDGVIDNGDGTYRENNIQISAEDYYRTNISLATESSVFDGTVYRLRELSLTYSLPQSILETTPFGSVSIGFSGRNLWFYAPNYYNDPEGNSQGAGNIQGVRLNGFPSTRNYSANLRFTF